MSPADTNSGRARAAAIRGRESAAGNSLHRPRTLRPRGAAWRRVSDLASSPSLTFHVVPRSSRTSNFGDVPPVDSFRNVKSTPGSRSLPPGSGHQVQRRDIAAVVPDHRLFAGILGEQRHRHGQQEHGEESAPPEDEAASWHLLKSRAFAIARPFPFEQRRCGPST